MGGNVDVEHQHTKSKSKHHRSKVVTNILEKCQKSVLSLVLTEAWCGEIEQLKSVTCSSTVKCSVPIPNYTTMVDLTVVVIELFVFFFCTPSCLCHTSWSYLDPVAFTIHHGPTLGGIRPGRGNPGGLEPMFALVVFTVCSRTPHPVIAFRANPVSLVHVVVPLSNSRLLRNFLL